MKARKASTQLTFEDIRKPSGRGGWRPGSGRPRGRTKVAHEAREEFSPRHPQHITLPVCHDVPFLRVERLVEVIRTAIANSHRDNFRITEFNVQSNHLHLITESAGREALSAGLQASKVRIARALNSELARTGEVFEERYHSRVLKTPREVRNALRYVLLNYRHHVPGESGYQLDPMWIDPFSSAPWFRGWHGEVVVRTASMRALRERPAPTQPATTWLLSVGWKKWGLIAFDEVPGPKTRKPQRRKG